MLKLKNIVFAALFAIIIFMFQNILIFGGLVFEGLKFYGFIVIKIVIIFIYYVLMKMILDLYQSAKLYNDKSYEYQFYSICSALVFVFTFSSTFINDFSLIFDAIVGTLAVFSFMFFLYFMEKAGKKEKNDKDDKDE